MKFIRPATIGDAQFVSSTLPESDYAAWSSGTTYAAGARCISTTTHRIYESVQASNLNHSPVTDIGTWWIDIGPTNRWAWLDQSVGTLTSGTSLMSITLAPGVVVDSLALLDVTGGGSLQVVMVNGMDTVYNQTFAMSDTSALVDWYTYFFSPIEPRGALIVSDLPPYSEAQITITVNGSAAIGVGTLVLGTSVEVGATRYGAGVGIVDYSRKETDSFGVVSVTERAYAKKIDVQCIVDNGRVDYVTTQLAAVRATPCIWVSGNANSRYESLLAYGFYKDFGLEIAYPNHSTFSILIEGLT